jgi:hypothetical protein
MTSDLYLNRVIRRRAHGVAVAAKARKIPTDDLPFLKCGQDARPMNQFVTGTPTGVIWERRVCSCRD